MSINWPLLSIEGTPVNGVDEIQVITTSGAPTGGNFALGFDGQTTATIAYNAAARDIEVAIQALSNVEAGDVEGSGGPLPGSAVNVTFRRNLGGKGVSAMTVSDGLTGDGDEDITTSTSTQGVQGTHRGAQYGALLQDVTNGKLYKNTGDEYRPVWTAYEP